MQGVQKAIIMNKEHKQWWEKLAQELSPQQRGYFLSLGEEGMSNSAQHYDLDHLKWSIKIGLERVIKREQEEKSKAEQERADLLLYQEAIKKGIYPLERMHIHPLEFKKLQEKIKEHNLERWEQLMWLYNHEKLEGYEFLILDRWRAWFPNMIYHLHMDILFSIMIEQTRIELAILDRTQAQIQRAMGITDMEILQEAQIHLYHYLIIEPPSKGRNYKECLKKDKELMKHANMSLEELIG
ncbi:hypothetical protein [Helicobacter suis]|uniref:hypothetical protein n=1 Tax=Helicobacter suis TaxID=104628 RepID=UPI0013D74DAC|nr:hypothetical protein [Helicobacter suis]